MREPKKPTCEIAREQLGMGNLHPKMHSNYAKWNWRIGWGVSFIIKFVGIPIYTFTRSYIPLSIQWFHIQC